MITRDQALSLKHGQTLYHKYNRMANGLPERWRVASKIKTWKTRPNHFQFSVKHGLYDWDVVDHTNNELLFINEIEAYSNAELERMAADV